MVKFVTKSQISIPKSKNFVTSSRDKIYLARGKLRTALGKSPLPGQQDDLLQEDDTFTSNMTSLPLKPAVSATVEDAATDQVTTKAPGAEIETEVTAEPTSDTLITVSESIPKEDPKDYRIKSGSEDSTKDPNSSSPNSGRDSGVSAPPGLEEPLKPPVWHSTNTANITTTHTAQQMKPDRTLLIAHFPRECYENDDVRHTLGRFGGISRINLISEPETKKPKCYGFVEFLEHGSAVAALNASQNGLVVLYDQRNHPWHVKAEWTRAYHTVNKTSSPDMHQNASDFACAQESFEHSTWNQADRKYPGGPMAPSRTLLIAYFPREATKEEITKCLSKHGHVTRVHMIFEKDTKKPKCYGFVEFNSTDDASAVLAATEGGAVTMVDTRDHMWHLRAERVRAFDRNGPLGAGKIPGDMKKGKRILGQDSYPGIPPIPPSNPMMNMMAPPFPPPIACAPPPAGFPNPRVPPYSPSMFAPGLAPPEHFTNPSGPPRTSPNGTALFQKEVERQAAAKAAEMMAGFFHLLSAGSGPSFPPGFEGPGPMDFHPHPHMPPHMAGPGPMPDFTPGSGHSAPSYPSYSPDMRPYIYDFIYFRLVYLHFFDVRTSYF